MTEINPSTPGFRISLTRASEGQADSAGLIAERNEFANRYANAIEAGEKLLDLLESIVDEEPCRYDHNNSCQTHMFFYLDEGKKCPMGEALAVLKEAGR